MKVRIGEDFSMRAGVCGCCLVLGRSALENLPRWKPRGLGGVYGDFVQVVDGTVVSADRSAPGGAAFGGAISRVEVFAGPHFDSIVAKSARGIVPAQDVRPGSACRCRFERVIGDGRCVMRPAPEVARATLVSGRGGRFR